MPRAVATCGDWSGPTENSPDGSLEKPAAVQGVQQIAWKSSSKLNWCNLVLMPAITPAFWYSPTRFSKKLVLPCKEMISIQSKGLTP